MRALISIVLPVYNGAKYVRRALDSILAQTYERFEVIVVNDCSTDNTLEILREYEIKDARIKVFRNETNLKLPKTLNKGFENVSGEYLTWTSDDNIYHKDALEKMVHILDEKPDVDLVYADFSIVDMEGNLIKEIEEDEPIGIRFKDNIGACFLYRKSLAEKVGEYDPQMFLAEDYDFFIRCHKESNGGFYHIKEDLYDYGRHETSLTSTRQAEISHKAFDVMMKNYNYLYSLCFSEDDKIRFFNELLRLLHDPKERDEQRRSFCKMDDAFRKYDFKCQLKKNAHRIVTIVPRAIYKMKKIIQNC